MIFYHLINPERFLYRLKKALVIWDLNSSAPSAVKSQLCGSTQWKNGR